MKNNELKEQKSKDKLVSKIIIILIICILSVLMILFLIQAVWIFSGNKVMPSASDPKLIFYGVEVL